MRRRGERDRTTSHAWSERDDAFIHEQYALGTPVLDVADRLGVSVSAVRNRANKIQAVHRRMSRSLEERFWDYVIPEPNSGCFLWEGSVNTKGYGQIRVAQRGRASLRFATHVALELAGRPLPARLHACHTCDVPLCVNADHLFAGTQLDNMNDAHGKGRMKPPPVMCGSANGSARFVEAEISEIRKAFARGMSLQHACERFGIRSLAHAAQIRDRKIWAHVR
jgi:hypothetical protein